ncbi:hypothetical protein FGX01_03005 [Xylella fastidiosa subsp. multiplex]|nr:hypothetical protein [Xylella fastidiosa subsp. multiplex]
MAHPVNATEHARQHTSVQRPPLRHAWACIMIPSPIAVGGSASPGRRTRFHRPPAPCRRIAAA